VVAGAVAGTLDWDWDWDRDVTTGCWLGVRAVAGCRAVGLAVADGDAAVVDAGGAAVGGVRGAVLGTFLGTTFLGTLRALTATAAALPWPAVAA
jgi:hypothetical protein